ncbi:MAG: thioredoxin family protein [Deltaproteobacteria bacterium]|nr:thioredoxin family protein [Deltaproteobacteria bacterium]
MASVPVTHFNIEALIQQHELLILDFWADWCNPCRSFAPIFEQVSDEFPAVLFGKVDADAERVLADFLKVSSIPTTMVIKQGVPVFRQIGTTSAATLRGVVEQAVALNMEEVVAQARGEG